MSKSRRFYSQEAQRMKEKYFVNDGFIIIGVLIPVSNQRDNNMIIAKLMPQDGLMRHLLFKTSA